MTRKDYVAIADVIAFSLDDIDRDINNEHMSEKARTLLAGERAGVVMLAQRIASMLRADNPRFDRRRFIEACGLEWNA